MKLPLASRLFFNFVLITSGVLLGKEMYFPKLLLWVIVGMSFVWLISRFEDREDYK